MAPEALIKYGAASEVYSFGTVLLELAMGRVVKASTREDVAKATDDGKDPNGLAGQRLDC